MRLIDVDALEREGWSLCRTFQKDKNTMIYEVKKPSDFPTIEPERKQGRWVRKEDPFGFFEEIPVCSECGHTTKMRCTYNFCPYCGSYNGGDADEPI